MSSDNEVLWIVAGHAEGYPDKAWLFRTREGARLFVLQRKDRGLYTYFIKRAKWGPEQ